MRLTIVKINSSKMERQKTFKIGERQFTAKFPNVGQIIDLESFKQALTNNRYGQMAMSGVASMYFALDLVDAIAFYNVIVPEVGKYFDISNYATISLDKAKMFIKAYQEQIKPWYDKTMSELKEGSKDDGDTETSKED